MHRPAITRELEQELLLMTSMGDMPDVPGEK
jgi:hypothetical protein